MMTPVIHVRGSCFFNPLSQPILNTPEQISVVWAWRVIADREQLLINSFLENVVLDREGGAVGL